MNQTPTPAQNGPLHWVNFCWVTLAVFIVVGLAYYDSTDAPFIFDDLHNIKNNANVHITDLSPQSLINSAFGNPTPRPVAYLTFAINHYFGQQDVTGYHWVNILIHAINGLLVFIIAHKILEQLNKPDNDNERFSQGQEFWIALIAALIFVLHPIQTQSVTYVVQRMTSLCSLFYFAGILTYLRTRSCQNYRRIVGWIIVAVCWLLALGSKQFAVTLPLAILLIEWIIFQSGDKKWLLKAFNYFAITIVLMVAVVFAFKGMGTFRLFTRGYTFRDFTLLERLMTEGRVMMHYVSLVAWPLPSRLALIYDFPVSKSMIQPFTTIVSWLIIFLSLGLAFKIVARQQVLSFAIFWFFLHLAVESTIIPLELVYEHRLYLPLLGFCIALAYYCFAALKNLTFTLPVLIVILVALGIGTHQRNQTWNSERDFWLDNIEKYPGTARCHFNLGVWYATEKKMDLAFDAYKKSIEVDPNVQVAHVYLGYLFEEKQQYEKALKSYARALAIPPRKMQRLQATAGAYIGRGRTLQKMGRMEEARTAFDSAISADQSNHLGYYFRAGNLAKAGRPGDAVRDYAKCLKLKPDFVTGNNNFAWLLATHPDEKISNPDLAIQRAEIACELTRWKHSAPIATLAAAYARKGDFETAVKWQAESVALMRGSLKSRMTERLLQFKNNQPLIQE